jgi:hypothetical protein
MEISVTWTALMVLGNSGLELFGSGPPGGLLRWVQLEAWLNPSHH